MKPGIHPDYVTVNVHCACGATWTTRSTKGQELRLEICSNCHPFFTGKQRLIDSAGQIEKFTRKWGKKKDAPAAAPRLRPRRSDGPSTPRHLAQAGSGDFSWTP